MYEKRDIYGKMEGGRENATVRGGFMYNFEIKKQYISMFPEKNTAVTQRKLKYVFAASEAIEQSNGKDLAEFNREELYTYYKSLHFKSINSLEAHIGIINAYRTWYDEKYKHQHWFPKFSKEEKQELITDKNHWPIIPTDHIRKICTKLAPSITGFIVYAIYKGVSGEKLQELTLMKFSDIDTNNLTASIYHQNNEEREFDRKISIDPLFVELAQKADREEAYYDYNDSGKKLGYLEKSPYIVKRREEAIQGNISDMLESKRLMCVSKIKRLSLQISENGFNARTIKYNGMIEYIKEITQSLDLDFKEDIILANENRLILKRVAVKYGTQLKIVERVAREYFSAISG